MDKGGRKAKGLRRPEVLVGLAAAIGYLAISVLWIVCSDRIAARVAIDKQHLVAYQQYKGLVFVCLMAVFVGWLAYLMQRRGSELHRALLYTRTDPLTALPNRAVVEEAINDNLARIKKSREPFGIIVLDIRHLARVNHSLGRSGGDLLLRKSARRLQQAARPGDVVGRLDGGKFIVALRMPTDEYHAKGLGTLLCAALDAPIRIDGIDIHVRLQGGLAMALRDGRTPFQLLDAAERALQNAKRRSETGIIARDTGSRKRRTGLELEAELRRAIRERHFEVVFQPQVCLKTFELVGVEALVRWLHPTRGGIPPGEFIPMAESRGLIPEVTQQVLEKTLEHWLDWQQKGLQALRVGVNLSGLDLSNDRIVGMVGQLLHKTGIPGHCLSLEITETWLAEKPEVALGIVMRLQQLGVHIAIDDFGTGYSALSQLTRFPIDCVKVDRSFVHDAPRSPRKIPVLEAIRRMASTLGAVTLAEGAETLEEIKLLRQLGFDEVQGFALAKPVTPAVLESDFLRPAVVPQFEAVRRECLPRITQLYH